MKIHHKLPCAYHWVKPAAGREVESMAFSLQDLTLVWDQKTHTEKFNDSVELPSWMELRVWSAGHGRRNWPTYAGGGPRPARMVSLLWGAVTMPCKTRGGQNPVWGWLRDFIPESQSWKKPERSSSGENYPWISQCSCMVWALWAKEADEL